MVNNKHVLLILLVALLFVFTGCNTSEESPDLETDAPPTGTETPLTDDTHDSSDTGESAEGAEQDSTPPDVEVTWIEFTNNEKNFTLMHPSNWIIVDRERYGLVLRPIEGTQTTFYVDTHTSMFADRTYDDYIKEMIGDLTRIRSESTFGESFATQVNGYPFTILNYQETSQEGLTYYYKAFFTATTIGYIMYYVIPETELEMYQETMEEIALSFKFLN